MGRNILLSFVSHILILTVSGILYSMGNHPVLLVIVLLFALFGYIALGYLVFKPLKTVFLNLLSVSFVSSLGLVIGLYCLLFPSQMGFNWMLFLGYNLYIFGLVQAFQLDPGPNITFWFFAFPSLFLWIGLLLKSQHFPINKLYVEDSK